MNGQEKEFVTIAEAGLLSGLSHQTLRKFGDSQEIRSYKTPTGHRRFSKQDLEKLCNPHVVSNKEPKHQTHNYIYTRVFSKKQLDDLSRQIEYIQTRRPEYNSYTLVSDVASGINFKRKGLQTILDSCLHGIIGEVVIAHRDRLCRFGFDLVKIIIEKSGGTITVLDDEKNKSSEQELAEDLLSIVHIYSCRQMGKRSYKSKQQAKSIENKDEADDSSADDT